MRARIWRPASYVGLVLVFCSACGETAQTADTGPPDAGAADFLSDDTPDPKANDLDGDGYTVEDDCDDNDATVNPGADEIPYDSKDNDCNPNTPDDDLDGDGFIGNLDCDDEDPAVFPGSIELPYDGKDNDCNEETKDDDLDDDGYDLVDDCDDSDSALHPGAEEVAYDGLDNDCDPDTPDDDLDGDGYVLADDCDDTNPEIHPGAEEIPYDDIDNDCNPATIDDDLDGDGFPEGEDCDDTDPKAFPGAEEVPYDGKDNDCNPETLDDDMDGDGVPKGEDCDDADPESYPGAEEKADGIDNDCDGEIDEGTDAVDKDGDGYCVGYFITDAVLGCSDNTLPGDCDDEDASLTPLDNDLDQTSSCTGDCDDGNPALNGLDEDGDGITTCGGDCDDSDPDVGIVDMDGDGFSACEDDCADWDAAINPDADEVFYNDIDDDCDPKTSDDDKDKDGFDIGPDCDDDDPGTYPGAIEIPDNLKDEDCDGSDAKTITADELADLVENQGGLLVKSGMLVADEGPIEVFGDIIVPIGITLMLGPGVEIRFMGPYKILVHGTLLSMGTEAEPTHVTSGQDVPQPGDWHGIRFESVGTGVLSHILIDYASRGLDVEEASPVLLNSTIRHCETGIWVDGTDASPVIDHVLVEENTLGIMGSWCGWSKDVTVRYSTITNNDDGILMTGAAGMLITNSEISDNANIGVQTEGTFLWHNAITGNGKGIVTTGGWDTFERNQISENDVGIELGAYPIRVEYHQNNLENNADFSTVYIGGYDDGAVNAEFNWWGSKFGPDIEATIWDFFDDPELFYVDYIPFLRFPVASVGPIPEGTVDEDGDQFFSVASGGNDCDDSDPAINPDAIDSGPDGVDDDCDGAIDEDAPLDVDGDGFELPEDCDNNNASIYPGAPEIADNGVDENCNGYDLVSIGNQELDGVLECDIQLTSDASPFVVTGDIYVAPGCVLSMLPGAELRFDGFYSIIVYGSLFAKGNPGAYVVFTSNLPEPTKGSWNEILFHDIGTGRLFMSDIAFAEHGVHIKNTEATIKQSKVHDCSTGIFVEDTDGTGLIEGTEISANDVGIDGSWCGWSNPVDVRYCSIKNNISGLITTGSAKFDVRSSLFMNNSVVALEADGGTFAHNKFISNTLAMKTGGGWDNILFNEFLLNDVGISVGTYPTRPQIHYNTFKLNKEVAIKYVGGNENGPVNAQFNWWNSDDLFDIRDATWDIFDDPGLFEILVVPFLGEEHPSAGPIPQGVTDNDGDGFYSIDSGGNDCDDDDLTINPDAVDDDGDGVDDDCDGDIDEDVLADEDKDGFATDVDCDDKNAAAYPGAPEIPSNGVDENCNGSDLKPADGPNIGGALMKDTLLTAAQSPYFVTSDIIVLPGTVLFIEPGAELRFQGPYAIIVKGLLEVAGVELQPVVFTSDQEEPSAGDWHGIKFQGGVQATISYAEFTYVDVAVSVEEGSSPVLTGLSISLCNTGVTIDGTKSTAVLNGGSITECETGIFASWAGWSVAVSVSGMDISYNGNGILTTGSAKIGVSHCTITHNAGVGFQMDGNSAEHNFIAFNTVGIQTQGGWDTIRLNVLSENESGIKVGNYPTRPIIELNNIVDNTYQGLVYVGGLGDGPVEAANNWWGSADLGDVAAVVWDLYDDPTLFEVLYDPVLGFPQFNAGPNL